MDGLDWFLLGIASGIIWQYRAWRINRAKHDIIEKPKHKEKCKRGILVHERIEVTPLRPYQSSLYDVPYERQFPKAHDTTIRPKPNQSSRETIGE